MIHKFMLSMFVFAGVISAQPLTALSPQAQEEIGRAAVDYMKNNPETFMDLIQSVQEHSAKQLKQKQVQKINENKETLFAESELIPVIGNPEGKTEIVVFMDPFCHFCRKFEKTIRDTILANKDVKIIARDIAIMHPKSIMLIKAMLAAAKQGKYAEMQSALHKVTPEISEDDIAKIATDLGINVDKFRADLKDEAIERQIKDNMDLADALDIAATPSFIIKGKSEIFAGYLTTEQLKDVL